MNFLSIIKLKANIMIRKQLLNIILILFSPTNVLSVAMSQDLDKYIVRHQKQLLSMYITAHNASNKSNRSNRSNRHVKSTVSKEMHKFVA